MKDRIDRILIRACKVKSRSQAKLLIEEGVVYFKGLQVTKVGQIIDDCDSERLKIHKEHQYVGRGAHKIAKAIEEFNVEIKGKIVADIGASTGGFSEYVLRNGAQKVYAIDVGHGQLDERLINDHRVSNMEGINIRYSLCLEQKVDLCVVDLSYISLKLVLKNIFALTHDRGEIIALVKPQFEASQDIVGKGGVIRDDAVRQRVVQKLYHWCQENDCAVSQVCKSPITGKKGNVEYFFYFKKI
ncbi:MAG: TlyA family RNA methyltransferase [Bacteriovoracaceae bacterium]|nr:TlyA family RNA methyltransferase [Bacteriovoracaceae bacterium]